MKMVKKYLVNTIIGGLGVVLPIVIILYIFYLVYLFLRGIIRPVSTYLVEFRMIDLPGKFDFAIADLITIMFLLSGCFFIGMFVRTKVGKYFHKVVENRVLRKIPGYGITKEVVSNIAGFSEINFSRVVLCKPFKGDMMQSGFIMDMHEKSGYVTVFCPTGPNPTTGFIYHIKKDKVFPLNVSVDKGVKSILGCGVGSRTLIEDYYRKNNLKGC